VSSGQTPAPAVGRIVHYVAHGSADGKYPRACRAADVTESGTPGDPEVRVGLMVKNPTGIHFRPISDGGCRYDDSETPAPGTWHWPERA